MTRHAYEDAHKQFRNCAEGIQQRLERTHYDINEMHQQLQSRPSTLEDPYSKFIDEHGLYLNVCVHDWACEMQHIDGLFFNYTTSRDQEGVFEARARAFNEAKEAFATARFLTFLSGNELEFYGGDTQITRYADLLEYANYGLKSGAMKSAYTTAYSVFDKIAEFINGELDAELSAKSIYFDKVLWSDMKTFRMRPQIRDANDSNLMALSDLARDLSSPELGLKTLRDSITHRHLVVHEFAIYVGPSSSPESHIEYDDLLRTTIDLLTITKAALIYLASYLHQKDSQHTSEMQDKVGIIPVVWQDDF